jgi:hypothetical protein
MQMMFVGSAKGACRHHEKELKITLMVPGLFVKYRFPAFVIPYARFFFPAPSGWVAGKKHVAPA